MANKETEIKRKTSTVKKKNGSTKVETEFETYKKSKSRKKADINTEFDKEDLEAFEAAEKNESDIFEERRQGSKVRDEIIIIVSALISILLILGNYDCLGIIEVPFNFILFGLMGFFEYFFPFVLFAAVVYLVKNKRNTVAKKKVTVCAIVIICICALIHIGTGYYKYSLIKSFYKFGFKAKRGGGLLGDLIATPLCGLFKEAATVIILVFVLIICFMLLTGKAILSIIGQKSQTEYKKYQTNARKRQEERKKADNYKKENDYYYGFGDKPDFSSKSDYSPKTDYSEYLEPKGKSYAAPVTENGFQTVDYVPKRSVKRESFIDKLKAEVSGANSSTCKNSVPSNQSASNNVAATKNKSGISNINFGKKNLNNNYQPAQAPDVDMVEISGTSKTYPTGTSEIYQLEIARKFGRANPTSDPNVSKVGYDDSEAVVSNNVHNSDNYSVNSYTSTDNSAYSYSSDVNHNNQGYNENSVSDSGTFEDDNNLTTDASTNIYNSASSNSGISKSADESVNQASDDSRYKKAGVFARGDLVSSKAPESHSLRGKQGDELTPAPIDNAVASNARVRAPKPVRPYKNPPVNLLKPQSAGGKGTTGAELKETARKLQTTLQSFGVNVTILDITCGPSITQYELQPEIGVKVSKITSLTDDIKLALAASDIRIEAPIPGKSAIGIEVPNKEPQMVYLSSIFQSQEFKNSKASLAFAVGKDIRGNIVVGDIKKMPHLLVAGTTGSGKSVCLNSLILSILYKYSPEDVKMILIDPKMVEFIKYNGVPHLLTPVVNNAKKAAKVLYWAVDEMMKRYDTFAYIGVKDIESYNEKIKGGDLTDKDGCILEKMFKIVIVIDELADLMMVAAKDVEDSICRIAQLARACGIHLVVATQRPTTDVVTGLIKANIPSRIALKVASGIDSRTMIDQTGAEKLIGYGDMLYFPTGVPKPVRLQGPYVSDEEIENVVDFLKKNSEANYDSELEANINREDSNDSKAASKGGSDAPESEYDEYLYQAGCFIIDKQKSSIGGLQRQFRVGFNRAARIMDQLSEFGVVGPEEGTKPRQVLMTMGQFDELATQKGFK
jgi:S-DNA-T family DNA segregation ATPase FtsK/SpoIIIE